MRFKLVKRVVQDFLAKLGGNGLPCEAAGYVILQIHRRQTCQCTTCKGQLAARDCSYRCGLDVTTSEVSVRLKTSMIAPQEVSIDAAIASDISELEECFGRRAKNGHFLDRSRIQTPAK